MTVRPIACIMKAQKDFRAERSVVAIQAKTSAVLCALNSQFVHTNLAVRSIKAYADAHCSRVSCTICEHTVNEPAETIGQALLAEEPDIVAFSAYIWNITLVKDLGKRLKARRPELVIVLAGPEVSYNPETYLCEPWVDYVQCGEGERAMALLFDSIASGEPTPSGYGICYSRNGIPHVEPPAVEADLSALESPYTSEYLEAVSGRIAYFESSRGCPYTCAFCLSGACRGVRFFPMEYVKRSLLALWRSGAKTVKFIDRTFNADRARADEILLFLTEHAAAEPRGVCFHFEVAADRLAESTLSLLERAPRGLFQIEAGLQSFNRHTLDAVSRRTDSDKLCANVKRLAAAGSMHLHVDLIAGLPHEDLASFRESFDKAFALHATMLQLGFLKLLYGSALREAADEYGYVYSSSPPYEIRATRWLSENDMRLLKQVEDACEKIHNSGRFRRALRYVLDVTGLRPFDLFLGFGKKEAMPLDDYTALVYDAFSALDGVDRAVLRDKLCCDRLATNASGRLPPCLKIPDKRLAKAAALLAACPDTAPPPGARRAVCLLYTRRTVVFADYLPGESDKNIAHGGGEYPLRFAELDVF